MSTIVAQQQDERASMSAIRQQTNNVHLGDAYFSADVETDGPIPGPFSMLSFALVYAGTFDGKRFERTLDHNLTFYRELRPISETFEVEALRVNGMDRVRLCREGQAPERAMTD